MAGLYESLMNGARDWADQAKWAMAGPNSGQSAPQPFQHSAPGSYQGPQWMAGQPQPATPQQPSAPVEMTADTRGPSPFGVQAPASLPQQAAPLPSWVAEFLEKFHRHDRR